MSNTLQEIWSDDRFGRRQEAEDIAGYIETIGRRPLLREDHAGHVLAIDAEYGEGKTFFLRRLTRHLALKHPVAFVDAWADDLHNEPLIAIAATLQEALEPFKTRQIRQKIDSFNGTAAKVAKIVAKGLVKRGIGLMITEGAAEVLSDELRGVASTAEREDIKDSAHEIVGDVASGIALEDNFKKKLELYRDGRKAIDAMRRSLAEVVQALAGTSANPPIIIIIDELDRCRPSYAIKMLEEVKHIFDVQGVVFVLGMHHKQMSHSVAGSYGAGFDGSAYLSRFIDRRYALRTPKLGDLIRQAAKVLHLDLSRLEAPDAASERTMVRPIESVDLVTRYAEASGLSARDTLRLLESIEICLALVENEKLYAPYLLPLLISHLGDRQAKADSFDWYYWLPIGAPLGYRPNEKYRATNPAVLFKELDAAASRPFRELNSLAFDKQSYAESMVIFRDHGIDPPPYTTLRGYRRLVGSVARFTSGEESEPS
jgi:hypothetical protein